MYLSDFFELIAGIFGLIFSIVGAIFLLVLLWTAGPGPASCEAYSQGMNVKTEYKFWYGCFVTMPDGQILPENIANSIFKQEYKLSIKTEERK